MHLKKKKVVQERRRTEEFEAFREEVFGPRKGQLFFSNDDCEDLEMRARRESVRSL